MSHLETVEGSKEAEVTEKLSSFESNKEEKHKMEKNTEYDKQSCHSDIQVFEADQNANSQNTLLDEYPEDWGDFETPSNLNSNKQMKQKWNNRMKLKEYNIKANAKATVRPPSYYKFNRSTTHILQKLLDQQYSGDFHSIVGRGTNSVVIHANCYGFYNMHFQCGNALKVYKLSSHVERNNALHQRVQREAELLLLLRTQHFSNNTPHPVYHYKNVILMSFIGSEQESAPSISVLPHEKLNIISQQIIQEMASWYKEIGLVHGSLSANKVLYWMDNLYFVGWSHSVKKDHPLALKKLMKDCQFISDFFQSRDVYVKTAQELFKSITGLGKISTKVLQVAQKDLWKDPDASNPNRTVTPEYRTTRNRFK